MSNEIIKAENFIEKAIEKGVPVETLERLLSMRNQLKQEFARESFYKALKSFQSELPKIEKTTEVKITTKSGAIYSYKYAKLEHIINIIEPLLIKHGFSYFFRTEFANNMLIVSFVLCHEAGHQEITSFPVPVDSSAVMNPAQKVESASSYGRRIALCLGLGIVTAEDDTNLQEFEPEIKEEFL
jgi:hypothetical protein